MTELHTIKRGSKIYEEVTTPEREYKDSYLVFNNLDGMYSVCTAYDSEGDIIMDEGHPAIVHLSRFTPLAKHKDGYKIS